MDLSILTALPVQSMWWYKQGSSLTLSFSEILLAYVNEYIWLITIHTGVRASSAISNTISHVCVCLHMRIRFHYKLEWENYHKQIVSMLNMHSSKILSIQQGDFYYLGILSNPCTLHWKNQADKASALRPFSPNKTSLGSRWGFPTPQAQPSCITRNHTGWYLGQTLRVKPCRYYKDFQRN